MGLTTWVFGWWCPRLLISESWLELQEQLRTKTYRPGAYRSFYIRDPKRRLIFAAPFRDEMNWR